MREARITRPPVRRRSGITVAVRDAGDVRIFTALTWRGTISCGAATDSALSECVAGAVKAQADSRSSVWLIAERRVSNVMRVSASLAGESLRMLSMAVSSRPNSISRS